MNEEVKSRTRIALKAIDDKDEDKMTIISKKILKTISQQKLKKKENEKRVRSDHDREFENQDFANLCDEFGIEYTFSALRTSQQNGVIERNNRTL